MWDNWITRKQPTRGLVSSQTGEVVDWTARSLVNSWMLPSTVALSCYVSVAILQITKRLLCPLLCACQIEADDEKQP